MGDGKSAEVRRILDRYIVEVVEAYDLCPWAKSARLAGEITVDVVWGTPAIDAWVDAAVIALARPGTKLVMIVAPELAIDREALRAVRDEVATRIPIAGVAHFHPDAALDLSSPLRLVPFVRRAPDRLLQLVPLEILESVRSPPPSADRAQQAQILGGHASPPREDVASRIARANHSTVSARHAAISATLDAIAGDRRAAYARAGINACP